MGFGLYGSHLAHGSFYYDDWANAALTAYPPHPGYGGALAVYFSEFGFRPLLALYVPTLHEVFGLHEHWHIAWSVLLLCSMSAAVYLILRTLGLERVHAFLIAALVVVFPFSDSSTLWSTAASGHLVAVLYLLGLTAAVRALRATDRRRALWYHAASLALYAAAVTTYELVATAALASVLIYLWQSDLRRALTRFAVDVLVIGLALIWTGSQTAIDEVQSTGGALHHARLLVDQGLYIVAQAIEPFGSPPRLLVLAVALAVIAVGAAGSRLAPAGERAASELRRWVGIALAGILFTYVAWAVFTPADPYYEPTTLGVGNRVNCLAAIGLATLAYALLMIVGTLLFGSRRRGPVLATSFGVVVAAVVGIGYAHRVRVDISSWDLATRVQDRVFVALRKEIPQPDQGSTIYAYGFTNYTAPGVPSFAASWDLNGAVKLLYHSPSISGYPIFTPSTMVCAPAMMYPNLDGYTTNFGSAYGGTYLIDVGAGTVGAPRNQAQCKADLGLPASAGTSSSATP